MLKISRNISLFCFLLPLKFLCAFVAQKDVYTNRVVAYAEDSVITQFQIEQEIALFSRGRPMDAESKEEMEKKILNTIMEKKIIAKEFKRMKGQIPESYVQKRYDTVLKTRFGDDPLKISKALYGQGKTKLTYKDDLLEEVIMECMCERNVTKTNNVSPLEIQDYYDLHRSELVQKRQFDIDQIIVKKEDQEAIARINEYLASGWSYEKEYQEISQIPGVNASHMDALLESDLLPVITEKIEKMSINSLDKEPIDFGNQIIFIGLRGVREVHSLSLNEANKSIERILLNEKNQSRLANWVDGLRKKSYCLAL